MGFPRFQAGLIVGLAHGILEDDDLQFNELIKLINKKLTKHGVEKIESHQHHLVMGLMVRNKIVWKNKPLRPKKYGIK